MDLTTVQTMLIAIAPSFAAVVTILGCMFRFFQVVRKKDKIADEKLLQAENKLSKAYDDIAKIQAKCASMEKCLAELAEKKKRGAK